MPWKLNELIWAHALMSCGNELANLLYGKLNIKLIFEEVKFAEFKQ